MKYLSTTFHIEVTNQTDLQTVMDILSALLGDCGYESFEQSDSELTGYIQSKLYDVDTVKQTISDFPIEGVKITMHTDTVADCDWNTTWEEFGFYPISVGDDIIIYDARHTDQTAVQNSDDRRLQLFIEASQAFGTGCHQTTQMVLQSLIDCVPMGKTVLDCGCGTGILGIAALRLGATRVVGYDIDEWSTTNAHHNAALNHTENIEIRLGNVSCLEDVDGTFDIIMANINRNIITADLPLIVKKASRKAHIILSGFLIDDIACITECANSLGFQLCSSQTSGEWSCLTFSNCPQTVDK